MIYFDEICIFITQFYSKLINEKTLAYYCERIDRDDKWVQSYKHFVPLFIQEAKTKTRWEDWDKDVFGNFLNVQMDNVCLLYVKAIFIMKKELS